VPAPNTINGLSIVFKKEGKMNLQRLLLMKLIIFVIALLIVHPGFSQVERREIKSFSGYIESIHKDLRFIAVNEVRVFISSNTKIVNEKGNSLGMDNLKTGLPVTIEGFWKSGDIFAEKITIRTPKRKS
jgi:hypothetical protein